MSKPFQPHNSKQHHEIILIIFSHSTIFAMNNSRYYHLQQLITINVLDSAIYKDTKIL